MSPLLCAALGLLATQSCSTSSLCINGHPAPREHNLTYGGLLPRHGYERDHLIPLCLGGADLPGNVRHQQLIEAKAKNQEEKYLCEAYCAGRIPLGKARQTIIRDWPQDAYHGY
jgi:hypothetical protein